MYNYADSALKGANSMKPTIIDIPGIGPAAAEALAEHRIKTLAGLAHASVEKVSAVPGFSEARATKVIAAAKALLPDPDKAPPMQDNADDKLNKASKGKKDKDKKKAKGKKKDKKNKDKKKGKGKNKGKKKGKK